MTARVPRREAFAAMAEVDGRMSHPRSDSDIARVNREAATHPVPVSPADFSVLAAAEDVSRAAVGRRACPAHPARHGGPLTGVSLRVEAPLA